ARVWELVSDVLRMSEWSPQVVSSRLRKGYGAVALGAQFTNRNVNGEHEWITHGEIVRFVPEREIAFRIAENHVVWSFSLEPTAGGTVLTQRREAPDGISELARDYAERFLGGGAAFTETLRAGMRETVDRIRVAATR
ncbi:MAG: SRPBCC family protein, partial [Pseudonocardia sp.]|nr:SRPBCC family protein [Pseudonocardia sp.]